MSAPVTARLLPQHETVVRLVHALGAPTLSELLSEFRDRAISVRVLRYTLEVLELRGWIDRAAAARPESVQPRRGAPPRTVYTLSEDALAYMDSDARLPREPVPLGRTAPPPAARTRAAPAPIGRWPIRSSAPPSAPARSATPVSRHGADYEKYVPPAWQNARPGADEHRRYTSRGVLC